MDLYTATQNATYLSTAKDIAYAAIRDFSKDGIMTESCENNGPPDNSGDISAASETLVPPKSFGA